MKWFSYPYRFLFPERVARQERLNLNPSCMFSGAEGAGLVCWSTLLVLWLVQRLHNKPKRRRFLWLFGFSDFVRSDLGGVEEVLGSAMEAAQLQEEDDMLSRYLNAVFSRIADRLMFPHGAAVRNIRQVTAFVRELEVKDVKSNTKHERSSHAAVPRPLLLSGGPVSQEVKLALEDMVGEWKLVNMCGLRAFMEWLAPSWFMRVMKVGRLFYSSSWLTLKLSLQQGNSELASPNPKADTGFPNSRRRLPTSTEDMNKVAARLPSVTELSDTPLLRCRSNDTAGAAGGGAGAGLGGHRESSQAEQVAAPEMVLSFSRFSPLNFTQLWKLDNAVRDMQTPFSTVRGRAFPRPFAGRFNGGGVAAVFQHVVPTPWNKVAVEVEARVMDDSLLVLRHRAVDESFLTSLARSGSAGEGAETIPKASAQSSGDGGCTSKQAESSFSSSVEATILRDAGRARCVNGWRQRQSL
ncbi:unnamed protein product [Amoebophrya sp. A25]|nr:unnamed protein product [Amoebophrya sp. A25]|eukprot:GSA25T00007256001.1